jgi:hypothetical protein
VEKSVSGSEEEPAVVPEQAADQMHAATERVRKWMADARRRPRIIPEQQDAKVDQDD